MDNCAIGDDDNLLDRIDGPYGVAALEESQCCRPKA
jgi:hypothetical protein